MAGAAPCPYTGPTPQARKPRVCDLESAFSALCVAASQLKEENTAQLLPPQAEVQTRDTHVGAFVTPHLCPWWVKQSCSQRDSLSSVPWILAGRVGGDQPWVPIRTAVTSVDVPPPHAEKPYTMNPFCLLHSPWVP